MAGKPGRSGRRPLRDEEKRLKIIDKAWEIVSQYLNDPDIAIKDKVELASKLTTKDMPTQLSGMVGHLVQMGEVKIDDKPVEYDIGETNGIDDPQDTGNAGQVIPDSNQA